jgi:hypothetical protein
MTTPAGCWYATAEHRPTVGWCPESCSGPLTHSERSGTGERLDYCDAHAYWRRKTIGLPLVWRRELAESP